MTETSAATTITEVGETRSDVIGSPIPGVRLLLVKSEDTGYYSLYVYSKSNFKGYFENEEKTKEAHIEGKDGRLYFSANDYVSLVPSLFNQHRFVIKFEARITGCVKGSNGLFALNAESLELHISQQLGTTVVCDLILQTDRRDFLQTDRRDFLQTDRGDFILVIIYLEVVLLLLIF